MPEGIQGEKLLRLNLQHPVAVGDKLYFPFLHLGGMHIFTPSHFIENGCRIILMKSVLPLFPDVNVVLSHRKKHGDILLPNHMALSKNRSLLFSFNNLGNILAEGFSHCFCGFEFSHGRLLSGFSSLSHNTAGYAGNTGEKIKTINKALVFGI